jgi:hypothetical protein
MKKEPIIHWQVWFIISIVIVIGLCSSLFLNNKLNKILSKEIVNTVMVTNIVPTYVETYPGSVKFPAYISNQGWVCVLQIVIDQKEEYVYDINGVGYICKTYADKKEFIINHVRASTYTGYDIYRDKNNNIIKVIEVGYGMEEPIKDKSKWKIILNKGNKWLNEAIKYKTMELSYTNEEK